MDLTTGGKPDLAHGTVVCQPLALKSGKEQNGHGRLTERTCRTCAWWLGNSSTYRPGQEVLRDIAYFRLFWSSLRLAAVRQEVRGKGNLLKSLIALMNFTFHQISHLCVVLVKKTNRRPNKITLVPGFPTCYIHHLLKKMLSISDRGTVNLQSKIL